MNSDAIDSLLTETILQAPDQAVMVENLVNA